MKKLLFVILCLSGCAPAVTRQDLAVIIKGHNQLVERVNLIQTMLPTPTVTATPTSGESLGGH